ncbi:MAG: DUF421 domain-containing protein [Firmicutes bacterium]|nr:DUF421 domain-containing protein [Bacillota bacterium]
MINLLLRTVILYFLTLLAMKAMGKRQLGQLQPFELVVILIISEMASLAMQSSNAALANSIIPVVALTLLQIGISIANLKSEKFRALFCGRPVMIIAKGKLQEANMVKLRMNLNDLEELARAQGYFDISGIENAVMETNGQLSIMPRSDKRPLETGDVLRHVPAEQMGMLLILDGHVNQVGLTACGRDEHWLAEQLRKNHIAGAAAVFAAGLDEQGRFFWQKKAQRRNTDD